MEKSFIHLTADVSKSAKIGSGTKIWHHCHLRENALIGKNCIIGKNVYIDHDVKIGNNVKIQNNCSIYYDAKIEDGVFIGSHTCLINDKSPRAITKEGKLKSSSDWAHGKITVRKGASIGAGCIVMPNVAIGRFAMIGAGSVVTKDVADYALAYGNPAKQFGHVCVCGSRIAKLEEKGKKIVLFCSKCKEKIVLEK